MVSRPRGRWRGWPEGRYNRAVSPLDGVLFDLGGVVMDSPLHAIARYERDHGLPANAINRVVATAGEAGAWARLERGELTVATFCTPFEADCRAQGVTVDSARLMVYVAEASVPRPQMLEAIRRIRARGLRVGALTNNWRREEPRTTSFAIACARSSMCSSSRGWSGCASPTRGSTRWPAMRWAWRRRARRFWTTSGGISSRRARSG